MEQTQVWLAGRLWGYLWEWYKFWKGQWVSICTVLSSWLPQNDKVTHPHSSEQEELMNMGGHVVCGLPDPGRKPQNSRFTTKGYLRLRKLLLKEAALPSSSSISKRAQGRMEGRMRGRTMHAAARTFIHPSSRLQQRQLFLWKECKEANGLIRKSRQNFKKLQEQAVPWPKLLGNLQVPAWKRERTEGSQWTDAKTWTGPTRAAKIGWEKA